MMVLAGLCGFRAGQRILVGIRSMFKSITDRWGEFTVATDKSFSLPLEQLRPAGYSHRATASALASWSHVSPYTDE
jgi:hypothetical protein